MRKERECGKGKKRKAELSNLHTKYIVAYSKRIYYKATLIEASQERKTIYLLSDNLWFMVRFRFKRTVIRPKVNTVGNARDSSFVNLPCVSLSRRKIVGVVGTISAASVPAMENSRSAYFFQYPKKSGNLVKKRLYTLLMLAMAFKLELRFSPPSAASTQRISASHVSKSSGSYSYSKTLAHGRRNRIRVSYHLTVQSIVIFF
jgi:hypothetical protein